MTKPLTPEATKRVRASEHAIQAALKAIQQVGLPVNKVCVAGGQVEIHCGQVDGVEAQPDDGGLQDW